VYLIRNILLLTLALSSIGCTQLNGLSVKSEMEMGEAEGATFIASKPINLDPELMYELMLGELLLQRGQVLAAYDVFYQLAEQTREPELVERVFHIAMNSFSVERIQQSAELWRSVSPQEATPWRVGYLMALRNGDLSVALNLWENYRQRSEVSLAEDLKSAAAQAVQSTQVEIGLAFFERLQTLYPQEWAAGYAYGYIADQYGQAELAIEILEALINRLASPSEVYFALANLYIENDLAQRGLDQLADYVLKNPHDWSMQERYARLEVKAQRYEQAQARYLRIVKANPQAYTSKLSLALLLLEAGDVKKAGAHLEALVQVEGYQDVGHYYLGVIAQNQGQTKLALTHLEQVMHPNYHIDAKLLIAQIRFAEQGIDAAVNYLDQIETVDDEARVKVLRAKGIFFSQAGQLESAAESYRQAISLSEDPLTLRYSLAMVLYEMRAFVEYEALLEAILHDYPDETEALNALGYFYAEQKRNLDKAQRLLDRAMELTPNRYHILDSRGWLAYQQGKYVEAESYLEQAWSLQIDDEILIHLIKTKWALQKQDEAKRLWRDYHARFPNNERLQQLMQTLQR